MLSMSKSRGALWECLPLSNNCNTKTPPEQAISALPRPAINPWPCPTSFYVYKNKGRKKAPKAHLVVSFLLLGKIPTPGVYFCSLEPGFGFGSSTDHIQHGGLLRPASEKTVWGATKRSHHAEIQSSQTLYLLQ